MNDSEDKSVAIYQTENGEFKVDVQLRDETVWLTQAEMARLFNKDRTVITKHINKILAEDELESSVCAVFAHTALDGKTYDTKYYNLDMIISVGYRVNSKRGVQFRKWATKVLKEHLIRGYSINQDRLVQGRLEELRQTVELLSTTLINQNLVSETGIELVSLIRSYGKTWEMLVAYDSEKLNIPNNLPGGLPNILTYQEAIKVISAFKQELQEQYLRRHSITAGTIEGVSDLFGAERGDILKAILGNIEQTFEGESLYRSSQEKAANLLYFLIKDHPFSDGNKRIGSFLFMLYLSKAQIGLRAMGVSSMTALALLIAESNPNQKDLMIKLIINLITE